VDHSHGQLWVLSNGRRFHDREFARDFASTGCTGALIALHSHEPFVHDEITGVEGSFRETLKGLENLQELGIPLIIRFIAMQQNCKDATGFMKLVVQRFPEQRVLISGLCYIGLAAQRVKMLGIRFSEVKKYVQPALEVASEKGLLAGLHLMPVCVLDPPYRKYFDPGILDGDIAAGYWAALKIAKEDNEFAYPSLCKPCELKPLCKWEWDIYARRYGLSELHPRIK
jgi:hypothetical protein